MNLKFIGLIPARYASTRFPAKPLAILGGKPVVQHVYEQACKKLDDVWVCTDDERIAECVRSFGGKSVLTGTHHRSGTDRCFEAYCNVKSDADVVVNIQGDEPFIHPSQLQSLIDCFQEESTQIATLVKPFKPSDGLDALENPNSPKVVLDAHMRALYFSRSVIPYLRGIDKSEWLYEHTFYKHIGIYAYRASVLQEITSLPQGILERSESLEQLRWLENNYVIRAGITEIETIGIDTPQDLQKAEEYLSKMQVS